MKNDRKRALSVHYEIDIVPNEHGGYYARIPDFQNIFTGGHTYEEAMKNALEAIELMIEEYRDRNLPVPKPTYTFSGHFNVRMPKSLHRELVRRAEEEGVSLNAMITFLLTKMTGLQTKPFHRHR